MTRTVRMIATRMFEYQHRAYTAGEVFAATPADALVLRYRRQADFAPSTRVQAAATVPDPAPDPESASRRRRYQRRDLVPEP